jgi:hypothetical protein
MAMIATELPEQREALRDAAPGGRHGAPYRDARERLEDAVGRELAHRLLRALSTDRARRASSFEL